MLKVRGLVTRDNDGSAAVLGIPEALFETWSVEGGWLELARVGHPGRAASLLQARRHRRRIGRHGPRVILTGCHGSMR